MAASPTQAVIDARAAVAERDRLRVELEAALGERARRADEAAALGARRSEKEARSARMAAPSLVSWLLRMVGRHEQGLEAQREVQARAEATYRQMAGSVDELDPQIAGLRERLAALGDADGALARAWAAKEEWLCSQGGVDGSVLRQAIANQREGEPIMRRLDEAAAAGGDAEAMLERLDGALSNTSLALFVTPVAASAEDVRSSLDLFRKLLAAADLGATIPDPDLVALGGAVQRKTRWAQPSLLVLALELAQDPASLRATLQGVRQARARVAERAQRLAATLADARARRKAIVER